MATPARACQVAPRTVPLGATQLPATVVEEAAVTGPFDAFRVGPTCGETGPNIAEASTELLPILEGSGAITVPTRARDGPVPMAIAVLVRLGSLIGDPLSIQTSLRH